MKVFIFVLLFLCLRQLVLIRRFNLTLRLTSKGLLCRQMCREKSQRKYNAFIITYGLCTLLVIKMVKCC